METFHFLDLKKPLKCQKIPIIIYIIIVLWIKSVFEAAKVWPSFLPSFKYLPKKKSNYLVLFSYEIKIEFIRRFYFFFKLSPFWRKFCSTCIIRRMENMRFCSSSAIYEIDGLQFLCSLCWSHGSTRLENVEMLLHQTKKISFFVLRFSLLLPTVDFKIFFIYYLKNIFAFTIIINEFVKNSFDDATSSISLLG